MNPTLNTLKQNLATFWSERNKREQNLLLAAIVVIVIGLFYLLLIDPALSGRKDLEKKLPALRQQAAEVQALSREVGEQSGRTTASVPPVTRESLESSLNGKGLKPQSVAMTGGDTARVQLNEVSFSSLIDWLSDMQKGARLSVIDANIEARAKPDTVNATLTLRQQRREQSQ